jgi:peroxiredoxin
MDPIVGIDQVIPDFKLQDLDGKDYALHDQLGKMLVLVFWSAECPWSKRADKLIQSWRADWGDQVVVWMIAANANEGHDLIEKEAQERGLETVLIDEGQRLALQFGAMTTPHCFVIDGEGRLRYRGAIDDTTFRQREATRYYLKSAIAALQSGASPDPADTPGYGCTIVRTGSN